MPPAGALQAALQLGGGALGGALDHLLVFHSLSQRSSAAGLRCALAAGDAPLIARLDLALRVDGAGVSLPLLPAGTRLWPDEALRTPNRHITPPNIPLSAPTLGQPF